jgi:hypothetical protein
MAIIERKPLYAGHLNTVQRDTIQQRMNGEHMLNEMAKILDSDQAVSKHKWELQF